MSTTAPNPNFNVIASVALKKYKPTLEDNFTGTNPLWATLKQKGYIEVVDGGESLVYPLMYAQNGAFQSYHGYEELDITPQTGITSVEYQWKENNIPITISGREQRQNAGGTRIINLMTAKFDQASESMRLQSNIQAYGDGSAFSGKALGGLDLLVEEGGTWSTVGGINSNTASNSWFRNQWLDFNASYTSFSTAAQGTIEGYIALVNMYHTCSRGPLTPDLIVSSQNVYEAYIFRGEGNHLRITDTGMLDLGFEGIKFHKAMWIYDDDCPANTLFMLQSRNLKLVMHKGSNFRTVDFQTPVNQDSSIGHLRYMGNLVCNNRARLGRIGNWVF